MTEDVRRKMTEAELRLALADMRAIAQAEKDFTQTNGRQVDVSAEDVEAIRIAYLWLARLYKPCGTTARTRTPSASSAARRCAGRCRCIASTRSGSAGRRAGKPSGRCASPSCRREVRVVVNCSRAVATPGGGRLFMPSARLGARHVVRRSARGLGRPAGGARGPLAAPSLDIGTLPDRPGGEPSGGLREAFFFAPAPSRVLRDPKEGRDLGHSDELVLEAHAP
jgi:hypothetical protein